MKRILVGLVLTAACTTGSDGMGGDDTMGPDGGTTNLTCPLPEAIADLGNVAALKAQRCNVSGSMGTRKWYRLSATMANGDIVQLELYPNTGAFASGPVTTGTFPIDTNFTTCGVCLRAVGDKGTPEAKEYFGTGGTVTITALGTDGQPISATITNANLAEVDATSHAKIASGCSTALDRVKVDGTVMDVGMTGGGGGGGGGGGSCPAGVGD